MPQVRPGPGTGAGPPGGSGPATSTGPGPSAPGGSPVGVGVITLICSDENEDGQCDR
jgi:hypothetical protein